MKEEEADLQSRPGVRGEGDDVTGREGGGGGGGGLGGGGPHHSEALDFVVGVEEEDPDSVVNDFKSEVVDGKTLFFCSECNYQR